MENTKQISLIVGSGAVENAWTPVLRALKPLYAFDLTGDGANCYFARLIYLLRWYASLDNKEFSEKQVKAHLDLLTAIKIELASELKKSDASGEIKVRPQLNEIVKTFLFPSTNKSIIITTNWDEVLEKSLNSIAQTRYPIKGGDIEVHYIHGSVADPNTMYLPSEVTREPYRTKDEEIKLGESHGATWRSLENTNISILYGLSISPLDAELSQILAAGWDSESLEEIIIIDPDHKVISHRVKLLLNPQRKTLLSAYDPRDLTNKVLYD